MRKDFRGEFCVAFVRAGIVMNVIDYILDEAMVSVLCMYWHPSCLYVC